MENRLIFVFLVLLFSCNNKKENEKLAKQKIITVKNDLIKVETLTDKEKKLSINGLENSIWIIGSQGLNGETQDTIYFYESNKLKYINADLGAEICNYSVSKDTIIYKSLSTEFDLQLDEDVTTEIISRLLLKNNKLTYLFIDKKKQNDKVYTRQSLKKQQIYFTPLPPLAQAKIKVKR